MRYTLLVVILAVSTARAQGYSYEERSKMYLRQTLLVLSSCELDRSIIIAAPDTVRYIWGYDRIIRQDWSCRFGVQGGAFWLAARLYTLPPGRLLCAIVEDRGARRMMRHATGIIPCEAFEPEH